ncbi:GNAT family N-acetyltransferase [Paenibacillus tarimensis]
MKLLEIDDGLKNKVSELVSNHWGSSLMVSRGKVHHIDRLPGYVILDDAGEILALVTFARTDHDVEIVSLDSLVENRGLGSMLLNKIETYAREKKLRRVWLITTNDNTRAIRFYQRRGYKMKGIYLNAVHEARKIKPQIPRTGFDGIEIEHEIEFEKVIREVISASTDSEYEKVFKELPLGIILDYHLRLPRADRSWVTIWVEGYRNGEKMEPFHLTELSYGLSPNKTDEGRMGFGIINPGGDDALFFLYTPAGSTTPHKIKRGIISPKPSIWDYAIGSESIGLNPGETKILGVLRQVENSFRPYNYQDAEAINQMIAEDVSVLLLKIKVEKREGETND